MTLSSTKYSPVVDVVCNVMILTAIIAGVTFFPAYMAWAVCDAREQKRRHR